jgi:GNAT superfamily N-acetyltransferase
MTSEAWQLSSDRSWLQIERIHAWLDATYWATGIRLDVVRRAFENSMFVGAYTAEREPIGIARVVTDYATFAWLCDVIVVEAQRKRGIARAMVQALIDDPRMTTVGRWCLATRDAHGVYRPLGFSDVKPATWLERRGQLAAWQDVRSVPGYKQP